MPVDSKLEWVGEIWSVQPRIRLTRSFDERQHTYLGYVLRLRGTLAGEARDYSIGVGKAAHEKHRFRIGDRLRGKGAPVENPSVETADLYRVSGIKPEARGPEQAPGGPPFGGIPPALEVYRQRGHTRLASQTFAKMCGACVWGCEMAVELIIDPWKPTIRRYRRETFCYGPKSCPLYRPGPTRKVPGRKGMSWEEEDWVDEENTSHRGPDE
jgi:hypothetical protein